MGPISSLDPLRLVWMARYTAKTLPVLSKKDLILFIDLQINLPTGITEKFLMKKK